MNEISLVELHAKNVRDQLKHLQTETGVFARQLRDAFDTFPADIGLAFIPDTEMILLCLKVIDRNFESAEKRCGLVADNKDLPEYQPPSLEFVGAPSPPKS